MVEYNEKCPSLDLGKSIEFDGENQKFSKLKITLDCAVPVKEGSYKGKYGTNNWHLWFGTVEDKKVFWKDEKREELGYSGKVIFFPNDSVNEQLIGICDGNKGVSVEITKVMMPGKVGMITPYKVKQVEGGISPSNLTKDEDAFVKDLKRLKIEDGINIDEQTAITMANDDYDIKKERAKEILKLI